MKSRARAFEVVVLIALVASLAFFVRPEPPPPPAPTDPDLNLRVKGVAFGALCLAFPPALTMAPLAFQPDLTPKGGDLVSVLTVEGVSLYDSLQTLDLETPAPTVEFDAHDNVVSVSGLQLEGLEGEPLVVAGQTSEEVEQAMGRPTSREDHRLSYADEDAVVEIHFTDGLVDRIVLVRTTLPE